MSYQLDKILPVKVGTKAVRVEIHGLACLVQNNSPETTVYFKETREDDRDATAANGWALPAGAETSVPFAALELSLISTGEDTDVRIMVFD